MLEQMCRTCLATCGELVPIFSENYYVHNLPDKLLHTIRIEVLRDDDLPKMMCKKCIFLVDSLYCFKDQCEMAEIKLKKTVKCESLPDMKFSDSSGFNDLGFNKLNNPEENNSEAGSLSEDDYQIEYVSEEARLEVENAKKQSRNAKRKRNKNSGVKVKSVQILPNESKNEIYKNFGGASNYNYEVSELDEDINFSDSDDHSSYYVSEISKEKGDSPSKRKNNRRNLTSEKSKKQPGFKRKVESDDSYSHLPKVPKKVMFQENDESGNMQLTHMSENRKSKSSLESSPKSKNNATSQLGLVDSSSRNIVSSTSTLNNSLSSFELPKGQVDKEARKIMELRIQNLMKHVVLNIPEICAICSESFDSYSDVLKHKIEAHLSANEDCFFCPICHEKFFANGDLVEHLNDHTNIQSFMCILCSDNFYTEETLRLHLKTHVDLQEMKCHVCNRNLQRIQTLLNHLDIHINSKQLVCAFCTDTYKSKATLQRHIDTEHKRVLNNKSKYQAIENEQQNLTNNAMIYPCPYCEKTFSEKGDLKDHVFTHLHAQQYSCLVCEKNFKTQEERTLHMQEHMKPENKVDKKKFRCRVCHEILISRAAYGQHLKEKHWNSKQTSEILRELSESSMNEKIFDQLNKSGTIDTLNLT